MPASLSIARRRGGAQPTSAAPLGGAMADLTMGAGVTRYVTWGAVVAAEADASMWVAPAAGTLDQLRTTSKQGATGTLAFTVRKNAAATAVLIAATAGTGAVQSLSDLVNSFTVAAGDVITLEVVSTTVGASIKAASLRFTPG